MNRAMTSTLLAAYLCATGAIRPACAQPATPAPSEPGLLKGLGPPDVPPAPDHHDMVDPPRPGGTPMPSAASTASLAPIPNPDPALDALIESLKAQIAALAAQNPADLPAPINIAAARAIVDKHRLAAEAPVAPPPELQREADALAASEAAFAQKFGALRDALDHNQKPADHSATKWATARDEYTLESARLQAARRAVDRAARQRAAQTSPARTRYEAARKALALFELAAVDQSRTADTAFHLHRFRLIDLEQQIAALEQLRTERTGAESGRSNASTTAAYYLETDWFTETLGFITREMSLMGRAGPPADALAEDLPTPDWLAQAHPMTPTDKQRAKVRWLTRASDLLAQQLTTADTQQRRAALQSQLDALAARQAAEQAKLDQLIKDEPKPAAPPP